MISAIYVALHRLIPCSEICGGRLDIGFFLFQKQGLCVTVDVDLEDPPEKDLELVGVYGFVTDKATGESVLANNPDLSTDAGTSSIKKRIFQTSSGPLILLFCVNRLERHRCPFCFLTKTFFRTICYGR